MSGRKFLLSYLAASLFVALLLLPVSRAQAEGTAVDNKQALLAQLRKLSLRHEYNQALALLEQAQAESKYREDYDLLFLYAKLLSRQGRYQKAIDYLERCVQLRPKLAEPRGSMAYYYFCMGKLDEAEREASLGLTLQGSAHGLAYLRALIGKIELYKSQGPINSPDYLFAEGDEWQRFDRKDFPIKIAILVDPAFSAYSLQFKKAVLNSFEQWRQASGGFLRYKLVEQKEARIVCKLLKYRRASGFGTLLGETMRDDNEGLEDNLKFAKVEVFFSTDQDPREIEAITLHEVGHALGLNHSNNPRDIMFPTAREPFTALLTARDKNSIRKLYGIPPTAQFQ
ncbi:MAG: matrixin family metalloprotease [Candidatus Obscuribacterales bacterium]|nr:matrixin family metalloprotease [Candidatus Obscuribacterales bacterium]